MQEIIESVHAEKTLELYKSLSETKVTPKITFNKANWNMKITERGRGRMKLQIKLSNEESEAFNGFSKSMRPKEVPESDFLKMIFFMGVHTLQEGIKQNMVGHIERNKAEFEAKGISFDAEGNMVGMSKPPAEPEIIQ